MKIKNLYVSWIALLSTLAAVGSFAQNPPPARISTFSPTGLTESLSQARATFSTDMTAVGDGRANTDIFDVSCTPQNITGNAYWSGQRTLVYNFRIGDRGVSLAPGTKCEFKLKSGVKNARGAVVAAAKFNFQIDGPGLANLEPSGGDINEDQIFVLVSSYDLDIESVRKNLRFTSSSQASAVGFTFVDGNLRDAILRTQYMDEKERKNEKRVLVVKPSINFPSGAAVSLIWGKGIRIDGTQIGRASDLKMNFKVRPVLRAEFTCTRENARAGCNPILPMEVNFSSEISKSVASQIVLQDSKGKTYPAKVMGSSEGQFTRYVVFSGPFPANEKFKITLPADIRDEAGRPLSNAANFKGLEIPSSNFPPLAKFPGTFGLLESFDKPILLPVSIRNIEADAIAKITGSAAFDVSQSSVTVSGANFKNVVSWLKRVDRAGNIEYDSRKYSLFSADESKKANPVKIPIMEGGRPLQTVGLPLAGTGLHVVEVQSRLLGNSLLGANQPMYVTTAALATNLSVHMKWGVENSLAWVTQLNDGQPAANAKVAVAGCDGTTIWSGTANDKGIVDIPASATSAANKSKCEPAKRTVNGEVQDLYTKYDDGFFIVASRDGDFSFVHSGWSDGLETYNFGIYNDSHPAYATQKTVGAVVLDRSLFRAGEKVSMKLFARAQTAQGFGKIAVEKLPKKVTIQATTGDGETKEYPIDIPAWDPNNLTAAVEWAIPKDASLGYYSVNVDELAYTSFQVDEFKVPLMNGKMSLPMFAVNQEPVSAKVTLAYNNGGPAARQNVIVRHRVIPGYAASFPQHKNYSFYGDKLVEGVQDGRMGQDNEQATDPIAKQVRLDDNGVANVNLEPLQQVKSMGLLEVEMEYRDATGESQTLGQTRNVYPSSRMVGVRYAGEDRKKYYSPKNFNIDVLTVDPTGKPVTGPTQLTLFSEESRSHRTRLAGGFYSFENVREIKNLGSPFACTRNRGPVVNCRVNSPVTGQVYVQAVTRDDKGREHVSVLGVSIVGSRNGQFALEDSDRIDLIADKEEYKAGETAVFQIRMPYQNAKALVTVEREGVISSSVQDVTAAESVVRVPITEVMTPNIYVSALVVRGRVPGKAPAEVGAIDLAKPSFKMGLSQVRVNWDANRLNVTVNPERQTYAPRDTVTVDIEAVSPQGARAAGGEIALAVVDEGLLQLKPNSSWDLLRQVMGERALSVVTATAQSQVIGKRHFGLKAVPTGGGGGNVPTRELFDTLVYWNPKVALDGQGRARVTFPLRNDSLTKFRVVAVASQGLNKFGTGESSFVSKQDISIMSQIPAISRTGDELTPGFLLRNTTDKNLTLTTTTTVEYTTLSGEKRQQVLATREVEVLANRAANMMLDSLNIPDDVQSASFTLEVKNGDKVVDRYRPDAVKVLPAIPVRTQMAVINQVTGNQSTEVMLPDGAIAGKGGVKVSLMPTLAQNVSGIEDYFKNYAYDSIEFRVSRAVALNDKAVWDTVVKALPNSLDENGLIKFYPSIDRGDVGLTAYVLRMARDAEFVIPDALRDKMLGGLEAFVSGQLRVGNVTNDRQIAQKVAALNAVSRYRAVNAGLIASLGNPQPEVLSTTSMLDWLELLLVTPGSSTQHARALQTAVQSRWVLAGTSLRWNTRESYYLSSDNINTARVVLASTRIPALRENAEWGGRMPQLILALVGELRKGGSWGMTLANAWGSVALRSYAAVYEKTPVTGRTEVMLAANKEALDWQAQAKGGSFVLPWPASGRDDVTIAHQGTGKPWSVVASNAAIKLTNKVEHGFEVDRVVAAVPGSQATPGKYTVGDKLQVTVTVRSQSAMENVMVTDPVASGGRILGKFGSGFSDQGVQSKGAWPSYVTDGYQGLNAFYSYVSPNSEFTVSYQVELTAPGTFNVPGTRVEGVYHPDMYAELPGAQITVEKP